MNIAGTIIASLQQLGAEAGGLGSSTLGPSSILDMGFELYDKTVEATSELSWRQFPTALVMELMALAVLVVRVGPQKWQSTTTKPFLVWQPNCCQWC